MNSDDEANEFTPLPEKEKMNDELTPNGTETHTEAGREAPWHRRSGAPKPGREGTRPPI